MLNNGKHKDFSRQNPCVFSYEQKKTVFHDNNLYISLHLAAQNFQDDRMMSPKER